MRPVAIVAAGAISPLGLGVAATRVGAAGERPHSLVTHDAALARAGLKKPRVARAPSVPVQEPVDRARALLEAAAGELRASLDAQDPEWRSRRIAVLVGTSAGGMPSLERALATQAARGALEPHVARGAFYDGPLSGLEPLLGAQLRPVSVLGACAASTLAVGLGCRMLEAGEADLVLAGGYDALSEFIAVGFEALGATTATEPLPFQIARDGMGLGEGAALVALMRAGDVRQGRALGFVLGFGATSDATHVTAPDPTGRGLCNAARAALGDAGLEPAAIDVVSAHATATAHNDSAEARALSSLFGPRLASLAIHPFKAVIGHTLGAAGLLESLATLGALRAGVIPGATAAGPLDPSFDGQLAAENRNGSARLCLKLSSAFGGANAALVLGLDAASGRPRKWRSVGVLAQGPRVTEPDLELLARSTRLDDLRRSRLERASALAVTAAARALEGVGPLPPETTGVVVSTFAASLEANEVFDARRRQPGLSVEPRRFPATSPNLPAGVCSIAFDFRGPSLAVGGGPGAREQGLAIARQLIAGGDAEHVVLVTCDDVGPTTRSLCDAAGLEAPHDGAEAVVLGPSA